MMMKLKQTPTNSMPWCMSNQVEKESTNFSIAQEIKINGIKIAAVGLRYVDELNFFLLGLNIAVDYSEKIVPSIC
jgi:hypothetical protein